MNPATHLYKTADNCPVHLDVHLPPNPKDAPVVMWIHGGALINGARWMVKDFHLASYLKNGFAVFSIDYRLAPEAKIPAIVEDVRDAYQWVIENGRNLYGVDTSRVACVGHSAGGYLTFMAGNFTPRPRALVTFYGYGDLLGDWYTKPDPFYCENEEPVPEVEARGNVGQKVISEADSPPRCRYYLYCRQQGLWTKEVGGRDPETEPEFYYPYCPERNVTPEYPPTLLSHGDKDTDVPYEQSIRMANALSAAGVEHELLTAKGLGHGFDRKDESPDQVTGHIKAVTVFLKEHV